MPTPTYDLIDSQVLSTSAASVTFSSIPATYRDLVLVVRHNTASGGSYFGWRFNGDSGSNYSNLMAFGDGSAGYSYSSTDTIGFSGEVSSTTGNQLLVMQIMDYSATDKHKTVLTRHNRSNAWITMSANRWANTSAINSIYLDYTNTALDFASGSTFYLYGIAS